MSQLRGVQCSTILEKIRFEYIVEMLNQEKLPSRLWREAGIDIWFNLEFMNVKIIASLPQIHEQTQNLKQNYPPVWLLT